MVKLDVQDGDCVLFVDGLRLDVGETLRARLTSAGTSVILQARLAAIPTMTSSGKPAVAPLRTSIRGGDGLAPAVGHAELQAPLLRKLLESDGVQPIGVDESGDSAGRGWTETGDLDGTGHKLGLKIVDRIPQEVSDIVSRVQQLLNAGWSRVHVVTDHGWLLMPGGLPKVELAAASDMVRKIPLRPLARRGRPLDQPTFRWTWDQTVRIAVPRGVAAFEAGCIYEHGGVSPQECITPHLIVTAGKVTRAPASRA